jgi:ABC-2 type transport system permease protein
MNTYNWLIRREFWENRAIWMIPAVMSAVMVLVALFGKVNNQISIPLQLPSQTIGGGFLLAVGGTFFAVMAIYSTWYLLDCLYADRKDRSVLFWKSMPISDSVTVISKLTNALIVIPLVYFAAADVTALIMAFILSVRASPLIGGALWQAGLWLQMQVLWLYVIAASAIWYLPLAGYLLVVSAWAKRAVMLWSILPPIALILVERWFFGTHVIANQLLNRFVGIGGLIFRDPGGCCSWATTVVNNDTIRTPVSIWGFLNPGGFLSSPETWIGAAAGIGLIAVAIQLRRRRSEI